MRPARFDLGDGAEVRPFAPGDIEELFAVVDANRERLGPWMPWIEGLRSVDDERAWLERVAGADVRVDGLGIFVDGGIVGGIGMVPDAFGIAGEIGYWVSSEQEGRAPVTRACRALIDFGFRELGLHRIVIRAGANNARSRAIPERLGFTREGIARQEGRGSEGFYDLVVYGLLESEWPP